MTTSLTAEERETTINVSDADDVVRIFSARRTDITRMRKHDDFTEVDQGFFGGTEWATFTIPKERWTVTGVKRRINLTPEQRQAAAERLRAGRASE